MILNFSVNFSDLNSLEGLRKIDKKFLDYLEERSLTLHEELTQHRARLTSDPEFLIELSPYLDDFIAELFNIDAENLALKTCSKEFDVIYECRRKFVQRVWKEWRKNDHAPGGELFKTAAEQLTKILGKITEKSFAKEVINWLKSPDQFASELKIAADYVCYMVANNSSLPLFNIPRALREDNLLRQHKIEMLAQHPYVGFDYRDPELTPQNALANAKYCIYCHNQDKDSCRTGMDSSLHTPNNGCPLDQKISEMNKIFASGFNIGALGVVLIDNPLVAATGHRICNDCMKSCIFQKQDPVNIPLIESQILNNVLGLPCGVEIYTLLTKWNPLNTAAPLPKEKTNYNVLVVGLGPAGFALSHYLLNEGHNVVAIDGLKIQPLDFDITKPIKDWQKIKVSLSQRLPQGFGGVAEYGITNRWDKNNLILVRLLLERRSNFKMIGGVRLGSNISQQQAFELGFHHIALCLGAGKPRYINSESYFFKGVKSAADFLMNLQQGGSFLKDSNSHLLIRMPAVVIGCGLTAVDSAVEIMHYYPTQVEKFLSSYEQNMIDLDKLEPEAKIIAEEFIQHALLFRKAIFDKEKLDILQDLGGVSICYRGTIQNSAAYKRNHEEIEHAKSIGVKFIENISPLEVLADEYDYAKNVQFKELDGKVVTMPARTVLVAIGTEENEYTRYVEATKQNVTHFGDCNQLYSGSVVKALASAKNGYKEITKEMAKFPSGALSFQQFAKALDKQLKSKIHYVKEITPGMIELIIKSPLAARNYQAGQIFRFQNLATKIEKTTKPLALSPYEVDSKLGLISFLIAQTGKSTKLCALLKPMEEVVLMGPNGTPNAVLDGSTTVLVGYGIRNMALLPIAKRLKEQGQQIIFLAHYAKAADRLYPGKIEDMADKIIWSSEDEAIIPNREQDVAVKGDLLESILLAQSQGKPEKSIVCYVPNRILTRIKNAFNNSNVRCNLLSPMQCMMKGICGQCIQKVEDKNYIFACAQPEYKLQNFNPKILSNRLKPKLIVGEGW
jgi:NADPH-dependent glutamate synthase beta subunit-like oxidoreductase/NAD(P)H-flavin reductase